MKYFDLQGGKVTIHTDALAIPSFNSIWNSVDDKEYARRMISYIIFNNHPDSPYVISMPAEIRKAKLMEELLPELDDLTEEMVEAEKMYIAFNDTLSLKMLSGIRNNIENIGKTLNDIKNHEMSMRDMKDMLDLASKAEKAIKSLHSLEQQVRKDELDTSTVRGGGQIGYYEVPRKK